MGDAFSVPFILSCQNQSTIQLSLNVFTQNFKPFNLTIISYVLSYLHVASHTDAFKGVVRREKIRLP